MRSKTLHVDYLTRVEGEGSLYIRTKGNSIEDVQLKIFEPPRFFEALLRGRHYGEAPDITARICGICPIAYQMSSVNAMENALGVSIPDYLHQLRRLLYCGEWIESHTLHVFMLHAPDFLHYSDAIAMAKDHPEIVKKGLRLKKAGNEILRVVGGREIHPINVKVGGFYKLPRRKDLHELENPLKQARDDAIETIRWVNTFNFPDLERHYEFVALVNSEEYPMVKGQIASSSGLAIEAKDFDQHFEEIHAPYSHALQAILKGKGAYLVGPLARYNLNYHQLSTLVKEIIQDIRFEKRCLNPFRSIIVRSLEILYACDEALRIIKNYQAEDLPASVDMTIKASVGYGVSEAPRGLLYHRYSLSAQGLIQDANIVPPTSQNQKTIEDDLRALVSKNLSKADPELIHLCEQSIRNYDPCISCSAHFLKLERHNV